MGTIIFVLAIPNISRVSIFIKNPMTFIGDSGPCMHHDDDENEPNNVSIVSIVPGKVWTLSNHC